MGGDIRRPGATMASMKRKPAFVSLLVLMAAALVLTSLLIFWNSEAVADCTAVEFHEEYKDWKTANERYLGSTIAIRGEVIRVGDTIATAYGGQSVALGQAGAGVECH